VGLKLKEGKNNVVCVRGVVLVYVSVPGGWCVQRFGFMGGLQADRWEAALLVMVQSNGVLRRGKQ